jgi:hypothetical protein
MPTAEGPQSIPDPSIEREAKERWAAEARAWALGDKPLLRPISAVRAEVLQECRAPIDSTQND